MYSDVQRDLPPMGLPPKKQAQQSSKQWPTRTQITLETQQVTQLGTRRSSLPGGPGETAMAKFFVCQSTNCKRLDSEKLLRDLEVGSMGGDRLGRRQGVEAVGIMLAGNPRLGQQL